MKISIVRKIDEKGRVTLPLKQTKLKVGDFVSFSIDKSAKSVTIRKEKEGE